MPTYLLSIKRHFVISNKVMARQNFDIPFEAEDDDDAIDILSAFSIAPENSEVEITLAQPHNSNILDPGRPIKIYKGKGK